MKKGFTLIELCIVVAIIGILAAIAVPIIDKNKKVENKIETYESVTEEEGVYKEI